MRTFLATTLLLFTLFHHHPVFCSEEPLPHLSVEDCDPDGVACGKVNVVTGEFLLTETDGTVLGPIEMKIHRSYRSQDGWNYFPHTMLVLGKSNEQSDDANSDCHDEEVQAFCGEKSGSILSYFGGIGEVSDNELQCVTNGLVNCTGKEISGRTNFQNNKLRYLSKTDSIELTTGDGTKRLYSKLKALENPLYEDVLDGPVFKKITSLLKNPSTYFLQKEFCPNGNRILYRYDEQCRLKEITSTSGSEKTVFGTIKIEYRSNSEIAITTSGGGEILYSFDKDENTLPRLREVTSQTKQVQYQYEGGVLVKRECTNISFDDITYCTEGGSKGRVQSLGSPHGRHEFSYIIRSKGSITCVIDKHNNTTNYSCAGHRVSSVERYDARHVLLKKRRKFFGKGSQSSFIISEATEDSSGKIVDCTVYGYDTNGNVEEERLYGDLVGKEIPSIRLQPNGIPEKDPLIPCHVKKRKYSNDGLNLLVSQGDSKNGTVRYAYKPGTDLLVSQFIYDENRLRKRIFSTYDDNGSVIRRVTDDADQEYLDSRNFSEKQIVEVAVRTEYPVGLPTIMTEKYYDKAVSLEKVSKRILQTYDPRGLLLSKEIEGTTGEKKPVCSYRYDSLGQILEETDAKGITSRYAYDDNGLLTRKESDGVVCQYFYDHKGQLLKKEELYPSGKTFEERFAYDFFGNKISSTDIFGNTTSYEYDSFDRVTRIVSPEVFEKDVGLVRPERRYTYDLFDRICSTQDPQGNVTQFSYTLRGDPSSIVYPDGSKDLFCYDVEGTLHRKATADGMVFIYLYDFLGRNRRIERFDQAEKGPGEFLGEQVYNYSTFHLDSVCDERHYVTTHVYDDAGRLIRIEGGNGWKEQETKPKTCFEYDAFGRIACTKEWFGERADEFLKTSNTYDLYDRPLETTKESSDGTVFFQEEYTYDASGERTETTSRGHRKELIEYNDLHEPVRVVDSSGNEWRFSYGYSELSEQGQRVYTRTVTNPLGTKKTYRYDPRGALTSVSSEDPCGKLLEKSLFSYDLLRNLSEEVHLLVIDGKEQGEQRTSLVHDSMGRLLAVEKKGTDKGIKTSFEYNSRGQLTKRYEPGIKSPIEYSYRYDLYGSHVRITYPINDPSLADPFNKKDPFFQELTFDPEGLVTNAFSSGGIEVRRKYGFLGQVLEEELSIRSLSSIYTLNRSTDALGRTTKILLPDASVIRYRYDGPFLKEVARLSSSGEAKYRHTYDEYDPYGNPQKETLIGRLGTRQTIRDAASRITDTTTGFYQEHIAQGGLDPLGNILTVLKKTPVSNFSSSYSYNELSQLLSEEGTFAHIYGYDSLGNHRAVDGTECKVNLSNQLLSAPSLVCRYDDQGCVATKTTPSGVVQFSYDSLRHLRKVKKDGEEIRYFYDGLGRRLMQQHGSSSQADLEFFLYLDDEEIGLVNGAKEILQLKIPGLENSIAFELNHVVFAPLYDMQNNVVCLIDPKSKEVQETYEYSAFGEERIYDQDGDEVERSQIGNPWRFSGKRKDEISGCIFFGVRDYDPQLRKWTSPDPAGAIDGPNLYLYVRANPLTYRDELGFSSRSYYSRHANFQEYVTSERSENKDRGGDVGPLEKRSTPDYPRQGSFVAVYSTKYSQEQIIEKLKNEPGYSARVIGHINGIRTTVETVYRRAHRMIEGSNQAIDAVIIAYDNTEGWKKDLVNAREDINHIGSQNYRDIKQGLMRFFENFRGLDVTFSFHCHSRGAAIMDCLIRSPEFSNELNGGYNKFLGPIFTYGAISFIPSATNFVAPFDYAYLYNSNNASIMRDNPECIRRTSFRLQDPFTAHGFDEPSYQEAFQIAITQK